MSAARNHYFKSMRQTRRRRRLCTRCGEEKAKPGHTICSGCLQVMVIKRPRPAPETAQELKRRRLLARLTLIDEARRAVENELARDD